MARLQTMEALTARGVDEDLIGDPVLNPAQWETAAVRRLEGGEHVYEVFCCVEPATLYEPALSGWQKVHPC